MSPSRIVPARTGSKPAMARSTVVLPQPDGPSRQPMSPAAEREREAVDHGVQAARACRRRGGRRRAAARRSCSRCLGVHAQPVARQQHHRQQAGQHDRQRGDRAFLVGAARGLGIEPGRERVEVGAAAAAGWPAAPSSHRRTPAARRRRWPAAAAAGARGAACRRRFRRAGARLARAPAECAPGRPRCRRPASPESGSRRPRPARCPRPSAAGPAGPAARRARHRRPAPASAGRWPAPCPAPRSPAWRRAPASARGWRAEPWLRTGPGHHQPGGDRGHASRRSPARACCPGSRSARGNAAALAQPLGRFPDQVERRARRSRSRPAARQRRVASPGRRAVQPARLDRRACAAPSRSAGGAGRCARAAPAPPPRTASRRRSAPRRPGRSA